MVSPYIVQGNVSCSAPNISYSPPRTQTAEAGTVLGISLTVTGEPSPVRYQMVLQRHLPSGIHGPDLRLTNVQFSDSGTYVVVITNAFGAITGVPITLNVIAAVEHRPSAGLMLSGETGTVLNVDYVGSPTGVLNWLPLGAVRLTSASQGCFDVTEPLPPQRYYRVWQTGYTGPRSLCGDARAHPGNHFDRPHWELGAFGLHRPLWTDRCLGHTRCRDIDQHVPVLLRHLRAPASRTALSVSANALSR